MSERGLVVDDETHELILGESFYPQSRVAFHSIRYDFKPASVDTTKDAQVDVGEGHHVTLTVPHVEGSGKSHTVYKGNKKPVSKECVLIIDHDTGTFTLERLTNNINVKKTRTDNTSKVQIGGRPSTPVEQPQGKIKSSPTKVKSSQSPSPHNRQPSPPARVTPALHKESSVLGEISDSSSDSDNGSSASDSESDDNMLGQGHAVAPTTIQPLIPTSLPPPSIQEKPKPFISSIVSTDLQLSDSSDEDSN